MQQDTLYSLNKFKYVVLVFLCLVVTDISAEDNSEINSTTALTTPETATAISTDDITSSSPGTTVSTISDDEIVSSTVETTVPSTTRGETIPSTSMATEKTILLTEEKKISTDNESENISSASEENVTQKATDVITGAVEAFSMTEKMIVATTEVETLTTSKIIKSEDLKMDNCASLRDCMECVKSSDSCIWEIDENLCKSPNSGLDNSTGSFESIENENYSGEINRKGASFCPRIVTSRNITVPSDTQKMVKIKVSMKHLFTVVFRFTCRFGDGPDAIITSANLLVDTIYCGNAHFSYPSDEPFVQLPVWVLYGGKELSNPKDIKLIIYKCRFMADNCISCLSFGRNYECGWCPGSSTCEIAGQCEETTVENLWIGRKGLCPQLTQ
uniref:Plxna2 protein n=1 Tax=Fopius arisanus TaxID=64838 RepID=A0A0C9RMT7_9HYME